MNLNPEHIAQLVETIKTRFENNMTRHQSISWEDVEARLLSHPHAIETLHEMERTGGEPDVIAYNSQTGKYTFCDCSPESPSVRRSLCYDRQALDARKEHKPSGSAQDMAQTMGITLLTEEEYRALQEREVFDTKTSSWIATPAGIRNLGGAIFADRRYNTVFVYHNGAESYYASRGFRGKVEI